MRNTRVSSNIKKILSLLVVLCMLVALVPATNVSASSADIEDVVNELDANLTTEQKELIVKETWQYIVNSIGDDNVVTVDDVLTRVVNNLSGNIEVVSGSNTAIDKKVSEEALRNLIEIVLSMKGTLIHQYNEFKSNGYFDAAKLLLGVSDSGSLFVKVLDKMKANQVKIVTMENNQFVKYDPDNKGIGIRIASIFGLNIEPGSEAANLVSKVDEYYNQYIAKMNQMLTDSQISPATVINILKHYNIYQTPVAPTTPPTSDPGVIIPVPTATPTPTATPNPIIPGGAEEVQNIKDPTAALNKAVELISGAAKLINNAEASAKSTNDISQAMLQIAQAALEKVNTQTVTSVTTAGEAKAVLSESDAAKLTDSIDKILETAQKLTDSLKSAGADTKVEAVLNIKASAEATTNKVAVEIPASLLAKATEKKLDKVVIDTGVAKMVVAPDAISVTGNKAVVFTATKLDNAKLPEDVKKITGDNAVYDYKLLVGDEKVTNFNKPIEIQIPYSLKVGENANKITVFYIDDAGKVQNVVGTYDAASGSVKFKTNHFSYYVVKTNNVTFKDISSVEWARENIETMAAKGVIGGIGNDMYAPEASITRAEFAAMMVRAFKLQDSTAKNTFTDVNDNDWFASEVAAAVKAGLVTGNGDGTFTPDANITREDMAVIMARALTSVKAKTTAQTITSYIEKFTDKANISDYAKDAVALSVKYEIVKGMTTDTFVPANDATRAEAAAMMYRIFFLK